MHKSLCGFVLVAPGAAPRVANVTIRFFIKWSALLGKLREADMEEHSRAEIEWQELAVWLVTKASRDIRITHGSNHDPRRHLLLASCCYQRFPRTNSELRPTESIDYRFLTFVEVEVKVRELSAPWQLVYTDTCQGVMLLSSQPSLLNCRVTCGSQLSSDHLGIN